MDSKTIIGTVIGAIVNFFGGFVLFGLALKSFFASQIKIAGVDKTEVDLPFIFLGCLFFAFLLTYIFSKWAGIKTAMGGAKAGGLIALLVSLSHSLIMLGTTNIFEGLASTGVSAIAELLLGAVTGAAIGWWLGRE